MGTEERQRGLIVELLIHVLPLPERTKPESWVGVNPHLLKKGKRMLNHTCTKALALALALIFTFGCTQRRSIGQSLDPGMWIYWRIRRNVGLFSVR
jgi:hypothetical protein